MSGVLTKTAIVVVLVVLTYSAASAWVSFQAALPSTADFSGADFASADFNV